MKRELHGLATEPFMAYVSRDIFVPYTPPNSLPFPGPGWHKGPAVQSDLPPGYNTNEGRIMSNYGRIGDVPFSTVVGPVRAPNASFYRPGGVGQAYVGPAPYIPPGLPGPIYPNVGWHFGPSVFVDREDDDMEYGADDTKPADESKWMDYAKKGAIVVGVAAVAYHAFGYVMGRMR